MDISVRNLRLGELETWKANLAYYRGQAAKYGMSPPVVIENEIQTALRNIKRIEQELDTGEEKSTEVTIVSIVELIMQLSRRIDQDSQDITMIKEKVFTYKSIWSRLSLISSVALIATVYTMMMIKEARDAALSNPGPSITIIVLTVLMSLLLYVFSRVLSTQR